MMRGNETGTIKRPWSLKNGELSCEIAHGPSLGFCTA